MSKVTSLIKKTTVFEKLAVYGKRTDFLKSIAQMDPVAQQEAFAKAKEYAEQGLIAANKFSDLDDATRAAFSALPPNGFKDSVELTAAITKLVAFAQELYRQGKEENSRDKMMTANQVMSAANGIHREVAKMKAAWPDLPNVDEAQAGNKPTKTTTTKSRLQTVKEQINYMNALANNLSNKTGPSRAQVLKSIDSLVASLQVSVKNNNWGEIKDYIVGRKLISDALRTLYNDKLSYDDLKLVPALNFGKGVPEAAY